MLDGIVVIGDPMRPDGVGQPGGTDRPTRWLWSALRRSVFLASGLASDLLTPTSSPALWRWIESLRPAAEADGFWASVYAELPRSMPRDQLILDRVRGRFCIGYEMPPWLVRLLDEHEVPYVDIRLHPIRFLDDLIFAARASNAQGQANLVTMAMA